MNLSGCGSRTRESQFHMRTRGAGFWLGWLGSGLLLVAVASTTLAEDYLLGPAISVVHENDMIVRTDRHYTAGSKLNYLGGEVDLTDVNGRTGFAGWLAKHAPSFGPDPAVARLGLGVGQNIYTPTDTATRAYQPNDRPYAGVLYASLVLQTRGTTSGGTERLDIWRLDLGVIGPASLAEDAQNTVHRVRDLPTANGWANQLQNEPALALRYQRTWRFGPGGSQLWSWDFLPTAGASLGNIGTYAALGGQVRWGRNLTRDFGPVTIDSINTPTTGRVLGGDNPTGFYVFAGVEGRAVGYNSVLDGNLFRTGHHVDKFPLVGDTKFGAVFTHKWFDVTLAEVIRTKEFIGQKEIDAFGSLSVSFKWDRPTTR
ncbi:MAG: lipid A deacylase LpxR family protein [Proteobacteria bacterium]|nr:lipid A deacylase LpxR family protein [Pseudomonadota bacterium]